MIPNRTLENTLRAALFLLPLLASCRGGGEVELSQRASGAAPEPSGSAASGASGGGSIADEPAATMYPGLDWSPLLIDSPRIATRDAGDVSFARQVLPKLLGRRPLGWDEVKLMTDLIAAGGAPGRSQLMQALMRDGEFVSHWEASVRDWMHIESGGVDSLCFGTRPGVPSTALARAIRANAPDAVASKSGEDTMSDVIRSALVLDDLSAAYQAGLVTRGWSPDGERAAKGFLLSYLNRDPQCLGCHNSDESRSGFTTVAINDWDRTHPTFAGFERALLGGSAGRSLGEVAAFFRSDARSVDDPSWGLWQQCAGYPAEAGTDGMNQASFGNATVPRPGEPAPNLRRATPRALEASFRRGVARLAAEGLRPGAPSRACDACTRCVRPVLRDPRYDGLKQAAQEALAHVYTTPARPWMPGTSARPETPWSCAGCHSAGTSRPFLADLSSPRWDWTLVERGLVTPGDPARSRLYALVDARAMPFAPEELAEGDRPPMRDDRTPFLRTLRDWISAMPEREGPETLSAECIACDLSCDRDAGTRLDADAAFAYLVAEHITDQAYEAIFGEPLTIANYFPRNTAQSSVLKDLTEHSLLSVGRPSFSLKRLLERMLASPLFNRLPPSEGPLEPYELPMILDPWVERDPRNPAEVAQPSNSHNAASEGVHRHLPRTLMASLARALDWPVPDRLPFGGGGVDSDENRALFTALGQYMDDRSPGFKGIDLQGLARWEYRHGTCQRRAPHDWIDGLAARARDAAAAGGKHPPTYGDLAAVLKDRLISDPIVEAAEAPLLAAVLGVADLDTALPADAAAIDQGARAVCGILIETPHFMLAGIAQRQLGPRPRLAAAGGYLERCRALVPAFAAAGRTLVCHDGSLELYDPFTAPVVGEVVVGSPSLYLSPASPSPGM
jgi:hypothetical protein